MKKVFITGAAGFVGGRLVEILKEQNDTELHVLVRNISRAARISRYSLNYFHGSIADEAVLDKAIDGCDTVVHCAHDFSSAELNVQAATIIARLCLKHKLKRLIYISTFGVHITEGKSFINETSAYNLSWDYAVNKLEVEKKLLDYFQSDGLPVVILRPTVVYGPFSSAWATNTVMQMLENRLVVPYKGERICNAVYIDDVAYSIIRAIDSSESCNGNAYIVSGPDTVTWKNYYNSFLSIPGLHEPVYLNDEDSEKLFKRLNGTQPAGIRTSLIKDPVTFLKKTPIYTVYQRLLKNQTLKKKLLSAKSTIPRPLVYPSKDAFDTISCTGKASTAKLKSEIGFHPKVSFAEGMKKTMAWVEWANLNSNG